MRPLETLDQIEDFRALVNNAEQVVTSTKLLKKANREQGGKLTPEQKKTQSETAKLTGLGIEHRRHDSGGVRPDRRGF